MSPDRSVPFRAGGEIRGLPLLESASAATYLCDISEFEPDIADAAYLAWSKAIIIRALYGDAHDDAAWYGGARRADLHKGGVRFLGVYQYLVAGQSGAAQAQAFHKLVGAIQPGEVFIADLEEGNHTLLTSWYNAMISLYGSGISKYLWTYTGLAFGEANGILPVQWIAAYQSSEPSSAHKLWQFSDSYSVPGVGKCDCSVFHGTIDQLAALAYQPSKPKPPSPPADWTYGAPQHLAVHAGHTNVHATWAAPAGAPTAPDHYEVWIYKGTVCNSSTLVASYPRPEPGPEHKTDPDPGGLARHTEYTMHVSAFGPGGSRAKADVFASATFTTG